MAFENEFVVILCKNSSVHTGYLVAVNPAECWVILSETRCVWRWVGANSLNELANNGASLETFTRISEPVEKSLFTDVDRVISCTPQAEDNLRKSRWL